MFALIPWAFALGNLKRDLGLLWGWLCHRSFWQLVCMGLAVFAVVQHFQLVTSRHSATKWHNQFNSEHAAREADRQAYQDAQAQAAALNKAQVAHIKQEQQEITDATVSHLTARLQLIDGELRRQASAAPSSPNSPTAGDPGATPCRVTNSAWLCLSPSDRLRAAENEERHDELIDWVIAQSTVDPNKP